MISLEAVHQQHRGDKRDWNVMTETNIGQGMMLHNIALFIQDLSRLLIRSHRTTTAMEQQHKLMPLP